jgi:mRNA interferase YafQ
MRSPSYGRQFERDVKLAKKRGKDMAKLAALVEMLTKGGRLPPRLRDHQLTGNYVGRRECHLEPDWLVIYRFIGNDEVRFERTGTHADLFR